MTKWVMLGIVTPLDERKQTLRERFLWWLIGEAERTADRISERQWEKISQRRNGK